MARWGSAYEVAEEYRNVILAEMDARQCAPIDLPNNPRSYVGVGAVAVDDCCGQLVVTVDGVWRSVVFPQPSDATPEQCWNGSVALSMKATVIRCVPTIDAQGHPPSIDAVRSAHQGLYEDAAAIWDAVSGAQPDEEWQRAGLRQIPVSAEGGCIGMETTWTVGLDQETWGG